MKIKKRESALAKSAQALAGAALGAATSWILYSNLAIDHDVGLPKAIAADRDVFFSDHAGKISYYVDREGSGRPLVLIHSVNAAASAYEMRPLFEHYRLQRPVFAPDLPGYGFSERSPRIYTPQMFAEAILDLTDTLIRDGPPTESRDRRGPHRFPIEQGCRPCPGRGGSAGWLVLCRETDTGDGERGVRVL